jgi:hypothetical protein
MTLVKLASWAMAVGLAVGSPVVGTIAFPAGAIAQAQTSELDQAIAEGYRLFQEGSAESLRKAIGQFEKALELARSAKAQDKQALSLQRISGKYTTIKSCRLVDSHEALPD